ncbi:hypothetical protein C8R44DRAFT_882675 [Mycena epipterygia]|nr:hypothetical protein C8R44DRAFT_882675 [Mycena epipterygia]
MLHKLFPVSILAILVLAQGAVTEKTITCGPGFPICPTNTVCCPLTPPPTFSDFGTCLPECPT